MTKLFTHPWHTNDNATFEREYECWFANMCTNKCGGMEPNAGRNSENYTHHRDYAAYKSMQGKEEYRGRGWCPPNHACYD